MTMEEIPATQFSNGNMFEIQTSFPVLDVHRFFMIPDEVCANRRTQCEPLAEWSTRSERCKIYSACGRLFANFTWTNTDKGYRNRPMVRDDGTIDMEHRTPKATLCAGTFSLVLWQWERYIRGMLPTSLKDSYKVYVEYIRWFNPITKYDDDIQIPDYLTPSLSHLVASKIIDSSWQFRSGDWSYHYSMFERTMDMAYDNQPQTIEVLKMIWF